MTLSDVWFFYADYPLLAVLPAILFLHLHTECSRSSLLVAAYAWLGLCVSGLLVGSAPLHPFIAPIYMGLTLTSVFAVCVYDKETCMQRLLASIGLKEAP